MNTIFKLMIMILLISSILYTIYGDFKDMRNYGGPCGLLSVDCGIFFAYFADKKP